jgi:hypothetical protein
MLRLSCNWESWDLLLPLAGVVPHTSDNNTADDYTITDVTAGLQPAGGVATTVNQLPLRTSAMEEVVAGSGM